MKCPACKADVEDGADLCLECGEPMGDSPAAKLARQENVIRPPPDTFAPGKPPAPPPPPKPTPPPATRPAGAPPIRGGIPTPPPATRPAGAAPPPGARKKWPTEEPEPKRCPGCGVKTLAARCPGCGTKLHSDDE